MEIKEIEKLYKETFGNEPKSVKKLPGAGSSRSYYRIFSPDDAVMAGVPPTVIATHGEDTLENRVFCRLADFFGREGVHVPGIYRYDDEYYLQTDHGDRSLMDLIKEWHRDRQGLMERLVTALKATIDQLVKVQSVDDSLFDGAMMAGRFSSRQVKWDLNYFKYNFLKPSGVEIREEELEEDFEALASWLVQCSPDYLIGFMYRDFQSRNVLLHDEDDARPEVTLIDFQGGREGPLVYDIVSLLWQAKAQFPMILRLQMLKYYSEKLAEQRHLDPEKVEDEVMSLYPWFVIFRTLQVLGAYGFRGLVERKAHFLESIPDALHHLEFIVNMGWLAQFPELERCCERLVNQQEKYRRHADAGLHVEVFSFSYKKGYPEDWSGNGGGFMFDCRAMHNPGRYEEYKELTGLDEEVIDFLEERGEVQRFLEAVRQLTEPAVACYERRGFTNLQIGFGCTGGRHRSVYCAQHLAEYLAEKFPGVTVELHHREQGISETFNGIQEID